ncbi:MAG: SGNH/GDSL hydrolase family protein [Anaerolineae bacterium]|nr:SGNH/GDSL hydrolase family protein [Anaerolineae bacterium]
MPHSVITHLILILVFCAILAQSAFIQPAAAQNGEKPLAFEAVDLNNGADLVLARAAAIDLTAYPVLPAFTRRAEVVFAQGQTRGRAANVISKVGDCNSTEWLFLHAFGLDQYDLGDYAVLQPVVDHFSESFADRTYAAHNGLNAQAVLDSIWADPFACEPGESPLLCEYRVHNPGIAVIMFGTNDLVTLTPVQFDQGLRQVVHQTIQAGVVPLLSTFPRHLTFPEQSILFNQIVVRVARDFSIPLINLWLALEPLPDHGIADDNFHLNGPLTRAGDLSQPNLQTGYPLRNLVTLQALDVLWRAFGAN